MNTSNEIVILFNEIFQANNNNLELSIEHLKEMGYGINYHTFDEQPGRRFTSIFTKHEDLNKEKNPVSTGAIFDLNGKLRSYPGNKANDFVINSQSVININNDGLTIDNKQFSCEFPVYGYMYYSGTRMMLWNSGTNEQPVWRLSTSKAVNAFESKWNTEVSFGQMFTDLLSKYHLNLNTFCENLNTSYCYSFMMVHPDMHNIVSSNSNGNLYLVGVYDVDNYQNLDIEIIHQQMFNSFNNLVSKIETRRYNSYEELQQLFGRIANGTSIGEIITDVNYNYFKVLNKDFSSVHNASCVSHNNIESYFQLRNEPTAKELYETMFPDKSYGNQLVEEEIKKVIKILHSLYIKKFPMKQDVGHLDKPIDVFLRHVVHNHYMQNKEKIKYEKVLELFNDNEKFKADGIGYRQHQLYTSVKETQGTHK
jgi:hypothetical protein